jgi:uncharacterized membrane protein (UPF0127 family)
MARIINQTKNAILAIDVIMANTVLKRMKGLLGRRNFRPGESLVLKPSNSIHTLFMNFPIDVLFLDKENKVIDAVTMPTSRLSKIYFNSILVVELPAGTISQTHTQKGDFIDISL